MFRDVLIGVLLITNIISVAIGFIALREHYKLREYVYVATSRIDQVDGMQDQRLNAIELSQKKEPGF